VERYRRQENPVTYRLAIVSDVHADLHALEDALRCIDAMGCDAIVCAGDTVDYGSFPNETLALLEARGIPIVRGNHDRWALDALDGSKSFGSTPELTTASRRLLQLAVPSWSAVLEGVRVEVHHGSPRGDMDGIYPPDWRHPFELHVPAAVREPLNPSALLRGADVLVCGHTHLAFELRFGARLIVNPGALLRDRADGPDNPPATGTFGVLSLPERRWRVYRAKDGDEIEIVRSPRQV
jgi:predicted phosphodiesterase